MSTHRWYARFLGRAGAEDGSEVVTFVLLAPMLILFFELIVVGGRLATTHADIQSAAREAARQASIAAGSATAGSQLQPAVDTALSDKGLRCQAPSVVIGDDTNFVPGGWVEAEVTCTVSLSDLGFLGAPGSFTVTRGATEPVDFYRVVEG